MGRKATLEPKKDESKNKWVISIPPPLSPTGKRKREYFDTKIDAQRRGDELRSAEARDALIVRRAGTQLIRDAVNFDELLRDVYGLDGGLREGCERLMAILDQEAQGVRFVQLLDEFEKDNQQNWGPGSVTRWQTIRKRLRDLEDKPAISLDKDFWKKWIKNLSENTGWADQTYNDFVAMLSSIWKHAVTQDMVPSNPIEGIKRRRIRRKHKPVYEVEEVERLLNCAWENDRDLVPYFAIAIFAGLRPESELEKLQWEDVNFETCEIRVAAEFDNKTGQKRFVPMEENLVAWLKPFQKATGPVARGNLRRRKRALVRGKYQSPVGTPEKDWKNLVPNGSEYADVSRHTYGSYLDAKYKDRNLVMANMGHTNFTTYEQHYKNARSPKEAERFWNILPP